MKKKLRWEQFKQFIPLYLMMLPGVIYVFINNYIPMAGIIVAFKKYNVQSGIWGSPWAGLSNFNYLFGTSDSWIMIRNTLLYNIAFIIVNNIVAIVVAILITDVMNEKLKKLYQSGILFPFMISMVVVSYIVYAFLSQENGMINSILTGMGLERVNWYSDTKPWPFILVFVNCWKSMGYGTLIYTAAIIGISPSYYDAAKIDGANRLQLTTRITLPCLVPSVITLVILNIGKIFYSDFSLFYQVTQNSGALYDVTTTIDTYVYRALTTGGGIGRSSAAGMFQSIVGFILVVTANAVTRKFSEENAIF